MVKKKKKKTKIFPSVHNDIDHVHRDITIGSAFKDHPALFPIFEKCIQVVKPATTNDIIRSILVYFIVFWNMKEVVTVPTTLTYATQLEETIRLVLLLKPVRTHVYLVDKG